MKPTVRLVGEDGNVFTIIGKVKATLAKAGQKATAQEFTQRAFDADSYDHVLQIAMEYVEVT